MLILVVLLIVNVQSFQLSQSSVSSIPPIRSSVVTKKSLYHNTKLYGIDFDGIGNDEECDFTDGDLSKVDLSKCLPFPSPDILAEDVVTLCMDALSYNDEPKENAGLQVCFNFSSDRCRAGENSVIMLCCMTLGCTFGRTFHPAHSTTFDCLYISQWTIV